MILLLKILGVIVPLLLSVAYFTLAERKLIGSIQRRRGPNVVGYIGLLQPLADGLKLFVKESIFPSNANRNADTKTGFGAHALVPKPAFSFSLEKDFLLSITLPFSETIPFKDSSPGSAKLFCLNYCYPRLCQKTYRIRPLDESMLSGTVCLSGNVAAM